MRVDHKLLLALENEYCELATTFDSAGLSLNSFDPLRKNELDEGEVLTRWVDHKQLMALEK